MKLCFYKFSKGALLLTVFLLIFLLFHLMKIDAELKEACKIIGEKAYARDKEKWTNEADFFFEPKFTFNKELNTCLYSGGYQNDRIWERWVGDGFTNKLVMTTFDYLNKENRPQTKEFKEVIDLEGAEARYWQRHRELFNF